MPSRNETIRRAFASLALPLLITAPVVAQGGFVPGGRTIVALDFATVPLGTLPAGVLVIRGNLRVVDKDGVRMLRAGAASEFVLELPEALPRDFTLEFDIIPKSCCAPEDLAFGVTPTQNRGGGSAHIAWHRENVGLVGGGGEPYQAPMRADLSGALAGQPTQVAVNVEDGTVRMYTNGLRLFTLERRFVRGRVLRVFLGGNDEAENAVYLSRLRVAEAGGAAATAVGQQPSGAAPRAGPRTVQPTGTASSTSPTTLQPTGTSSNIGPVATQQFALTGTGPVVASVSAQVTAQGSGSVTWAGVQGATSYFVVRWRVDDPACCANTSPPAGMTSLAWQDGPLPSPGVYGYRVFATTATTIHTGETRVTYQPGIASSTGAGGGTSTPTGTLPAGPQQTFAVANGPPLGPGTAVVAWTPVANASAYRVHRIAAPGEPGLPLATVTVAEAGRQLIPGMLSAADLSPGFQYWVEAVFPDGSASAPGTIVDVQSGNSNPFQVGWPPVPGLRATVGGTMTITMPDGQTGRGSQLTWDWDQDPNWGKAYVYFVTIQGMPQATGGTSFALPPILTTETIRIPETPPVAIMVPGGVAGPPYTYSLPAGLTVGFCVAQMPIAHLVAIGKYTYLWNVPISCVTSQVPP